jgi:hypothetical protein
LARLLGRRLFGILAALDGVVFIMKNIIAKRINDPIRLVVLIRI